MNNRLPLDVFNSNLSNSNLIEASAGTGKTWSITSLYLRMVVEEGLLPENILVVTFTKAATAELAGRIRQRLQQTMSWLNADFETDDSAFFKELFNKWDGNISRDVIQSRLLNALAKFDRAAIFTIHSFCQRLLNDYAFEAGAQFNLTPVTDSSEQLNSVAENFWRIHMKDLTEDDYEWVQWLVEEKQSPESWLKQIQGHVAKPYQSIRKVKEVEKVDSTSLKDQLAQSHSDKSPKLVVVKSAQNKCKEYWQSDSNEIITCVKNAIEAGDLKVRYKLDEIESYVDALILVLNMDASLAKNKITKKQKNFCQSEIDKDTKKNKDVPQNVFFVLMDEFVTAYEDYKELNDSYQEQQKSYKQEVSAFYQFRLQNLLADLLVFIDEKFPELKSNIGIMDFEDMMLNVYSALKSDDDKVFSSAVAQQYKAAMIDEFQDTDPLQLSIFKAFFADNNTPLFYVGDPKQAIYSFRGADIFAYYQGAKNADTQQTLLTNYRSTPQLVDSVNALFSTDYLSFVTENIKFDWVQSNNKKQLVVEGQSDAAMQFVIAESEDEKAFSKGKVVPIAIQNTVQQITNILDKSKDGDAYFVSEDGSKEMVIPSDIAILVPTHVQAKEIAQALAKQGVMSVRQGKDKVLQSDAAKTLLRLMQAVAEPSKEARICELLADSLVGFSGPAIVALKEQGHQWEHLLEQFWKLKTVYLENGFSAMFRSWLNSTDMANLTLPQRLVEYAEGERNLTDLMHLAEILQQRSRQQVGLKSLISWLQYAINSDASDDEHQLRLESDAQRVKICTLHASKGLEYNIVFCPFLWQGKMFNEESIVAAHVGDKAIVDFGSAEFILASKQAEQEQFMEQLRLLYVALTRGVHRCVIFWAHVQFGKFSFTANSALAWLLYGDEQMRDNPVEQLREKVKGMDFGAFVEGVETFQKEANTRQPESIKDNHASVSIDIIKEADDPNYVSIKTPKFNDLTVADNPNKKLYPSWLTASFSGLTAGQHASVERQERSEHADDVVDTLLNEPELGDKNEIDEHSIFTFPRGAMPGECLHSIFEHWDFNDTDKDKLKILVANNMNRFSIAKAEQRSQWYESVANAVLDTLNKPLKTATQNTGFCLAQVKPEDRQAELEFLLAAEGSTGNIQKLLADPKFELPSAFVEASKQLNNKHIQGYLTGFIDLVFKDDQGKYHVLDWKSNHLGYTCKDYAPHFIEHAMAETHYYLQALLYLLALHRYLQQQLSDYNIEQHLGGAWYAFVRGIDINQANDEADNGLYHFAPSAALILALDKQLIKQEAVA